MKGHLPLVLLLGSAVWACQPAGADETVQGGMGSKGNAPRKGPKKGPKADADSTPSKSEVVDKQKKTKQDVIQADETSDARLFVGGLAWGTDDESLRAAFSEFGAVLEAVVVTDADTGRSRGFGFVTYVDPGHADTAIQALDGTDLDGRNIRVNLAEEDKGEPEENSNASVSKGHRRDGRY